MRIKLKPPKRNPRWTGSPILSIDPANRNQNTVRDLVKHALVDIDEVKALDAGGREKLEADIESAVGHHRSGISLGKRGVSDSFLSDAIFLSDVARAVKAAGLTTTTWSRTYGDGHESLTDRVARAVGEVCAIDLPEDTKRIVSLARTITRGGL